MSNQHRDTVSACTDIGASCNRQWGKLQHVEYVVPVSFRKYEMKEFQLSKNEESVHER